MQYAAAAGVLGEDRDVLAGLRRIPADQLAEGITEYALAIFGGPELPGLSHSIIDGRLVAEPPEVALRAGRQAMVPVLCGANDRDMAVSPAQSKAAMLAPLGPLLPRGLELYDPDGELAFDELRQRVQADFGMVEPSRHLADAMAQAGQPTWFYRFSYVPEAWRSELQGALHASEIAFAFDCVDAFLGDRATASDRHMASVVSGYWVAFAKSADPNGDSRPRWLPHNSRRCDVLDCRNDGVAFGPDPLSQRLDLWRAVAEGASTQPAAGPPGPPVRNDRQVVTLDNFIRAETDTYFAKTVSIGGFGRLQHRRQLVPIDKQDVVRMNRDTIYSSGVFDLDGGALTVALPQAGKRFVSMQVISEDHYTIEVVYAPVQRQYTREQVGTRYVFVIIRILVDPDDQVDLHTANALQDAVVVEQRSIGKWDAPAWDPRSLARVRAALSELATCGGGRGERFGSRQEVDPVAHLMGTAIGWGGNPRSAAIYRINYPEYNDGRTAYTLRVVDVPVDGFWSVSVYNSEGFFEKNDRNAYSINSLTAKHADDGSATISFGGSADAPNYLPIVPGWNYTVRLYRPRKDLLDGNWEFPQAQPAPR